MNIGIIFEAAVNSCLEQEVGHTIPLKGSSTRTRDPMHIIKHGIIAITIVFLVFMLFLFLVFIFPVRKKN